MNEIIAGMKVLKLYAWEIPFMQRIRAIRDVEISMIKRAAYYLGILSSSYSFAPLIVSILSFGIYVAIDVNNNVLTPDKVFVCISYINIMRGPLFYFPQTLSNMAKLALSFKRIEQFLNAEEQNPESVLNQCCNTKNSIEIRKAYCTWGQGSPVIKDLSLNVKKGSLVAVVGEIGSGKSSLLSVMLGEMCHVSGTVMVEGKLAYVPQQPWIQNKTLEDNIIFSNPFDRNKYDKVIENCALSDDLTMLPNADKTEIGEHGINLSGGQKQRVSMARAVYSDADIYLLDDPLSSVDAHVGKHIFDNVIGHSGMLKGKTRIFVTHEIAHLHLVDNIIVLKDNNVREQGTYQELIDKKGDFANLIIEHTMNLKEGNDMGNNEHKMVELGNGKLQKRKIGNAVDKFKTKLGGQLTKQDIQSSQKIYSQKTQNERVPNKMTSGNGGKLVVEEKAEKGEVKWIHFKRYFKSVGVFRCMIVLCLYIVLQFLRVGGQYILSKMSDENEASGKNSEPFYYFFLYFAFGVTGSITEISCRINLRKFAAGASDQIHKSMLHRTLRGPLRFFDTNPTGRILNRFSSDIDILDEQIPVEIGACLMSTFGMIAIIIVITFATPLFITVLVPIGMLYILVKKLYTKTAGQVKRMESLSKSPIYAHFSESLTGALSIRAYRQQERLISVSCFIIIKKDISHIGPTFWQKAVCKW